MKLKRRETIKQLAIFLLICLPITWLLMWIGYAHFSEETVVTWAMAILNFSCFMPAIAAILSSAIAKVPLKELMLFPRLQGNAKVYFFSIAVSVLLSCLGNILLTVVFPEIVYFREETNPVMVVFMVLYAVSTGCLQFFALMGEEIGWMGYVFPRLEELCGTTGAIVVTGLIRGCWHLVMLLQSESFVRDFIILCISNILLGSVLVLVTKASGSVIPASVIHALTNVVPSVVISFCVRDEVLYQANYGKIYLVSLIPDVIIGGACYFLLIKKYKVKKGMHLQRDKWEDEKV